MKLGDLEILAPYKAGSGGIYTTDTTYIIQQMDCYPSRLTIYRKGNTQVFSSYEIASIGGQVISLGGTINGTTDRNYDPGDLVLLQGNLADGGGAGGSGAVNPGIAGDLAYYATSGTTVSELAIGTGLTINNGVLSVTATNSGGTVTNVATGTGLTGGPITTTGTISIANAGVNTAQLANGASTYAKLQNVNASVLLGNPTGSPATVAEIPLGAGLSFTNGALAASAAGTITNIATANGVTGGPITSTGTIGLATIAANSVLANVTAGTALPIASTPSSVLDLIGSAQGDILYRGGSAWAALVPSTAGWPLVTQGSAANPVYAQLTTAGIGANQVTTGTMAQLAGLSLLGNPTNGVANVTAVGIGSGLGISNGSLVATGSGGTVTSVGLTMPGGFSVANSPVTGSGTIAVTTSLNGIIQVSGGALSAISIGSGLTFSAGILSANSNGTVTSVGLSVPNILNVANSPITSSGTLGVTLANENANLVFAGPVNGTPTTPTFRGLVPADLPTTGLKIVQHYGTISTSNTNGSQTLDLSTSDWWSLSALTGPTTLVFSNANNGQQFTVTAQQSAGNYTLTWPNTITWFGSPYTAPTMPATNGAWLSATFKCIGTNSYFGWWTGSSNT